ncbi:hypothetical protein F7984_14645 [Pradoshia sp. D12]|uniref:hypothetical protein n=1 Tax=Pradoshia sp. D12 TaxID=2651284 RepID=UPI00124CA9D5|nr:hypothetical protein [Pradoshia sp. D12]QFK72391.1 hypothetical protein F7984_14645 [Pradoshia sp. D12]
MNDWYVLLIALLAFGIQYFLSTRIKLYWGSILPIVYLAILIYIQISGIMEYSLIQIILFAIVGELFLIGYWVTGRRRVDNNRKKELTKMRAYDI